MAATLAHQPREDRERREQWAREVLARLGLGFARDESGFYRPGRLTPPGYKEPSEPGVYREQLRLDFGPRTSDVPHFRDSGDCGELGESNNQ